MNALQQIGLLFSACASLMGGVATVEHWPEPTAEQASADRMWRRVVMRRDAAEQERAIAAERNWNYEARAQQWETHKPRPWLEISVPSDFVVRSQDWRDNAAKLSKQWGADARGLQDGFQASLPSYEPKLSLIEVVVTFADPDDPMPSQVEAKAAPREMWRKVNARERRQMEARVSGYGFSITRWQEVEFGEVAGKFAVISAFELDMGRTTRACRRCPSHRVEKHIRQFAVFDGPRSFTVKLSRDVNAGPVIVPMLREILARVVVSEGGR